jgi:hypothetical protein
MSTTPPRVVTVADLLKVARAESSTIRFRWKDYPRLRPLVSYILAVADDAAGAQGTRLAALRYLVVMVGKQIDKQIWDVGCLSIEEFHAHLKRYRESLDVEQSKRRKDAERSKPGPGKNVNARMLDKLQRDPEAEGWTAKQWATCLVCSESTVKETLTWRMLCDRRATAKAERAMDRSRNRRPSRRKTR